MSGRWFRFYASAMRHPKVARLSDKDFRLWTELLSIAAENDGLIPCLSDLKHLLNRRLDHLSKGVDRLVSGELIDRLEGGYEPHGWGKNQYKSDNSTDRVKKHRSKRNVSKAVTETPPDTDTDTDTENPHSPPKTSYAFEGRVIRLTFEDLQRWKGAFANLDLMPLLTARDDWLAGQPEADRRRWFTSTSSWLANRQQLAFERKPPKEPVIGI